MILSPDQVGAMLIPEDPAAFLREVRRQDFPTFLERAWPHICGGQLLVHNWHVDAIAYHLDRIANGHAKRLNVNLPPRNGKSNIITISWVAWMLGRDPSLNFVCVSYSNELSAKFARECLSIMQSDWYRDIFPRTIISARRSASYDFETSAGGGRLATSVTGTLTGRGGDIIILDDVIKPEEANSETTRNAVNDWYQSTLASRLNDKESGAIICVMQRLHQFDLSGILLEAGGWDHLSLPAVAPEDATIPLTRGRFYQRKAGDILHAARESRVVLDELRASMGSSAFAAQYLQDPIPAQGNVFKADWLKTYPSDFDWQAYGEIVQSWDTGIKAGQNNDWSVCLTALVRQRQIYLLHVWRGRVEFPDLKRKAIELAREHGPKTLLIEDKASGQQLIQTLRSESPQGVPLPIACTPELDKFSRAQGVSSIVEAGQLSLPVEAPWLGDFKSELLAFPNGRHDDQVDALSQLLDWARTRWMHAPATSAGPTLFVHNNDGTCEATGEDSHLAKGEVSPLADPWGA